MQAFPARLAHVVEGPQWLDLEAAYKSAVELAHKEGKFNMAWMNPESTWPTDHIPMPYTPEQARGVILDAIMKHLRGAGFETDRETIASWESFKNDLQRGITLVAVPDDDLDHLRPEKAKRAKIPTRPSMNGKPQKRPPVEVKTADQATLEVE